MSYLQHVINDGDWVIGIAYEYGEELATCVHLLRDYIAKHAQAVERDGDENYGKLFWDTGKEIKGIKWAQGTALVIK